jgi:predicted DNA-binding protein with PD1-like motif
MGSGVSTEVVSLVETVRCDKGENRLEALEKLLEKSDLIEGADVITGIGFVKRVGGSD